MHNPSAARPPRCDVTLLARTSHSDGRGRLTPEQIPSPQTIRPFLRPTLSAGGGGGKEDFFFPLWYYRRRSPAGVSPLHNRCFMRLLRWSQSRGGEEWVMPVPPSLPTLTARTDLMILRCGPSSFSVDGLINEYDK